MHDSADARAPSERIAKDIMNHEYMEAYRRAISFFAQTQRLASRDDAPPSFAELRRAAVSMVVHIAQGAGRPTVAEQRPWVAAARRRARECAALLADDPPEPVTARERVDRVEALQPDAPLQSVDPLERAGPLQSDTSTRPPDRCPPAEKPAGHDEKGSPATTVPADPASPADRTEHDPTGLGRTGIGRTGLGRTGIGRTEAGTDAEARTRPRERASPPSDDREAHESSRASGGPDEGHGAGYGPTHDDSHDAAYAGAPRIDRSDSGIETVRVRLARVLVLLIWLEAR